MESTQRDAVVWGGRKNSHGNLQLENPPPAKPFKKRLIIYFSFY